MDRMSLNRGTGAKKEGKKGRKKERMERGKERRTEETASSGVPMKKDVETEQLSAQASDASLPWQHRISGLRGNG